MSIAFAKGLQMLYLRLSSQFLLLGLSLLFGVFLTLVYFFISAFFPGVWPSVFIISTPSILAACTLFFVIYFLLVNKFFSRWKVIGSIALSFVLTYAIPHFLWNNQFILGFIASFRDSCRAEIDKPTQNFIDFLPCLIHTTVYWTLLSIIICYFPASIAQLLVNWRKSRV